MSTSNLTLAAPPSTNRDYWLAHAAGRILMEDVRGYALTRIDPHLNDHERAIATKAVDDTMDALCTVMDRVTGVLDGHGFSVRIKFLAQLLRLEETNEVVEHELDFFEFDAGGVCGFLDMWTQGEFGEIPTVEDDADELERP